jgi:hypothetical protein
MIKQLGPGKRSLDVGRGCYLKHIQNVELEDWTEFDIWILEECEAHNGVLFVFGWKMFIASSEGEIVEEMDDASLKIWWV